MTNLAFLIDIYPDIRNFIEEISIMGGCIGIGNWVPAAEFNIYIDPEAAKIVFNAGIKLTMIPLEITHTALITDDIIEVIASWKTEFST